MGLAKPSPQPPTSPQVAPLRARLPVAAPSFRWRWVPLAEAVTAARLLVAGCCPGVSTVAAVGCALGCAWREPPLFRLPLVKTFPAGQLDMLAAAAALVTGKDEGGIVKPPPLPPPPLDDARKGEALSLTGPPARCRSSLPV